MIYTDQLMREVRLTNPPSCIVSLVPSLTELLADLGLENEIAGITKFCIHPDSIFRSKVRVGGTKKINHDVIDQLNPDLIIANKEENLKTDIELLEKKYPVWVSDVNSLTDVWEMIEKIGLLCGKEKSAEQLIQEIKSGFSTIQKFAEPKKTLYLIWKDPYMAAGGDTFINEMMNVCGMQNVLGDTLRYPEISIDDIKKLNPELILLSSEPYPFKEKHVMELKALIPGSTCITVDGECFSWYGSHLLKSPDYFNQLINPTATISANQE